MVPFFSALTALTIFGAFSSSTHYQLNNYGVNSGGSNSTGSSTYSAQVGAGEVSGSASSGTTYTAKSGSVEAQQANVPGAPTLTGGYSTFFKFVISTGGNASDATYAVAVATVSNFSSSSYVQADGTLGSSPVFQTYAAWGGSSGSSVIGLTPGTTYYVKMSAMQGKFTNSAYGPSANVTTIIPSLTFSLSPNSINMGNLTAGSVITSPSAIAFTFNTNAANGGSIYMSGSNTGLISASNSNYNLTVSPPQGDLSSLSEGFGVQSVSASTPLSAQSPYNGGGNTVGAVYTTFQPLFSASSTVSSGTASVNLKARSSITTPTGTDYTDTLTFIAAASY